MRKGLLQTTATLLFFAIFFAFVLQPTRYMNAFFDGLTVWAHNVLPALFPFALLSTIYTKTLKTGKFSLTNLLWGVRCDRLFLCSFLCGYPVGARQISQLDIDKNTALKLCSFCSTPGPIFVIATVGTAIKSSTATVIICISQAVGMILNGLAYNRKRHNNLCLKNTSNDAENFGTLLTNSLLAVITVGGLIALFFMFSEMIQTLLPTSISTHPAILFCIGLLEMTSGILKICQTGNTFLSTVCASALLSFGGICVALQCFAFLSNKGIKFLQLLKIKCTQCAFATVVSFVLAKILL